MKEKFLLEDGKETISKFSFDYGITRIDKIQEDIEYKYPKLNFSPNKTLNSKTKALAFNGIILK